MSMSDDDFNSDHETEDDIVLGGDSDTSEDSDAIRMSFRGSSMNRRGHRGRGGMRRESTGSSAEIDDEDHLDDPQEEDEDEDEDSEDSIGIAPLRHHPQGSGSETIWADVDFSSDSSCAGDVQPEANSMNNPSAQEQQRSPAHHHHGLLGSSSTATGQTTVRVLPYNHPHLPEVVPNQFLPVESAQPGGSGSSKSNGVLDISQLADFTSEQVMAKGWPLVPEHEKTASYPPYAGLPQPPDLVDSLPDYEELAEFLRASALEIDERHRFPSMFLLRSFIVQTAMAESATSIFIDEEEEIRAMSLIQPPKLRPLQPFDWMTALQLPSLENNNQALLGIEELLDRVGVEDFGHPMSHRHAAISRQISPEVYSEGMKKIFGKLLKELKDMVVKNDEKCFGDAAAMNGGDHEIEGEQKEKFRGKDNVFFFSSSSSDEENFKGKKETRKGNLHHNKNNLWWSFEVRFRLCLKIALSSGSLHSLLRVAKFVFSLPKRIRRECPLFEPWKLVDRWLNGFASSLPSRLPLLFPDGSCCSFKESDHAGATTNTPSLLTSFSWSLLEAWPVEERSQIVFQGIALIPRNCTVKNESDSNHDGEKKGTSTTTATTDGSPNTTNLEDNGDDNDDIVCFTLKGIFRLAPCKASSGSPENNGSAGKYEIVQSNKNWSIDGKIMGIYLEGSVMSVHLSPSSSGKQKPKNKEKRQLLSIVLSPGNRVVFCDVETLQRSAPTDWMMFEGEALGIGSSSAMFTAMGSPSFSMAEMGRPLDSYDLQHQFEVQQGQDSFAASGHHNLALYVGGGRFVRLHLPSATMVTATMDGRVHQEVEKESNGVIASNVAVRFTPPSLATASPLPSDTGTHRRQSFPLGISLQFWLWGGDMHTMKEGSVFKLLDARTSSDIALATVELSVKDGNLQVSCLWYDKSPVTALASVPLRFIADRWTSWGLSLNPLASLPMWMIWTNIAPMDAVTIEHAHASANVKCEKEVFIHLFQFHPVNSHKDGGSGASQHNNIGSSSSHSNSAASSTVGGQFLLGGCAVWRGPRSESQCQRYSVLPIDPTKEGHLVCYYTMKEGVGTRLYDHVTETYWIPITSRFSWVHTPESMWITTPTSSGSSDGGVGHCYQAPVIFSRQAICCRNESEILIIDGKLLTWFDARTGCQIHQKLSSSSSATDPSAEFPGFLFPCFFAIHTSTFYSFDPCTGMVSAFVDKSLRPEDRRVAAEIINHHNERYREKLSSLSSESHHYQPPLPSSSSSSEQLCLSLQDVMEDLLATLQLQCILLHENVIFHQSGSNPAGSADSWEPSGDEHRSIAGASSPSGGKASAGSLQPNFWHLDCHEPTIKLLTDILHSASFLKSFASAIEDGSLPFVLTATRLLCMQFSVLGRTAPQFYVHRANETAEALLNDFKKESSEMKGKVTSSPPSSKKVLLASSLKRLSLLATSQCVSISQQIRFVEDAQDFFSLPTLLSGKRLGSIIAHVADTNGYRSLLEKLQRWCTEEAQCLIEKKQQTQQRLNVDISASMFYAALNIAKQKSPVSFARFVHCVFNASLSVLRWLNGKVKAEGWMHPSGLKEIIRQTVVGKVLFPILHMLCQTSTTQSLLELTNAVRLELGQLISSCFPESGPTATTTLSNVISQDGSARSQGGSTATFQESKFLQSPPRISEKFEATTNLMYASSVQLTFAFLGKTKAESCEVLLTTQKADYTSSSKKIEWSANPIEISFPHGATFIATATEARNNTGFTCHAVATIQLATPQQWCWLQELHACLIEVTMSFVGSLMTVSTAAPTANGTESTAAESPKPSKAGSSSINNGQAVPSSPATSSAQATKVSDQQQQKSWVQDSGSCLRAGLTPACLLSHQNVLSRDILSTNPFRDYQLPQDLFNNLEQFAEGQGPLMEIWNVVYSENKVISGLHGMIKKKVEPTLRLLTAVGTWHAPQRDADTSNHSSLHENVTGTTTSPVSPTSIKEMLSSSLSHFTFKVPEIAEMMQRLPENHSALLERGKWLLNNVLPRIRVEMYIAATQNTEEPFGRTRSTSSLSTSQPGSSSLSTSLQLGRKTILSFMRARHKVARGSDAEVIQHLISFLLNGPVDCPNTVETELLRCTKHAVHYSCAVDIMTSLVQFPDAGMRKQIFRRLLQFRDFMVKNNTAAADGEYEEHYMSPLFGCGFHYESKAHIVTAQFFQVFLPLIQHQSSVVGSQETRHGESSGAQASTTTTSIDQMKTVKPFNKSPEQTFSTSPPSSFADVTSASLQSTAVHSRLDKLLYIASVCHPWNSGDMQTMIDTQFSEELLHALANIASSFADYLFHSPPKQQQGEESEQSGGLGPSTSFAQLTTASCVLSNNISTADISSAEALEDEFGVGVHVEEAQVNLVAVNAWCVHKQINIYYFEVKMEVVTGSHDSIGCWIGLSYSSHSATSKPSTDRSVYYDRDGYFHATSGTLSYGPAFGEGDVIGCGVIMPEKHIFFTKNGQFLGIATTLPASERRCIYPMCGADFRTGIGRVVINFGVRSFRYNFTRLATGSRQNAITPCMLSEFGKCSLVFFARIVLRQFEAEEGSTNGPAKDNIAEFGGHVVTTIMKLTEQCIEMENRIHVRSTTSPMLPQSISSGGGVPALNSSPGSGTTTTASQAAEILQEVAKHREVECILSIVLSAADLLIQTLQYPEMQTLQSCSHLFKVVFQCVQQDFSLPIRTLACEKLALLIQILKPDTAQLMFREVAHQWKRMNVAEELIGVARSSLSTETGLSVYSPSWASTGSATVKGEGPHVARDPMPSSGCARFGIKISRSNTTAGGTLGSCYFIGLLHGGKPESEEELTQSAHRWPNAYILHDTDDGDQPRSCQLHRGQIPLNSHGRVYGSGDHIWVEIDCTDRTIRFYRGAESIGGIAYRDVPTDNMYPFVFLYNKDAAARLSTSATGRRTGQITTNTLLASRAIECLQWLHCTSMWSESIMQFIRQTLEGQGSTEWDSTASVALGILGGELDYIHCVNTETKVDVVVKRIASEEDAIVFLENDEEVLPQLVKISQLQPQFRAPPLTMSSPTEITLRILPQCASLLAEYLHHRIVVTSTVGPLQRVEALQRQLLMTMKTAEFQRITMDYQAAYNAEFVSSQLRSERHKDATCIDQIWTSSTLCVINPHVALSPLETPELVGLCAGYPFSPLLNSNISQTTASPKFSVALYCLGKEAGIPLGFAYVGVCLADDERLLRQTPPSAKAMMDNGLIWALAANAGDNEVYHSGDVITVEIQSSAEGKQILFTRTRGTETLAIRDPSVVGHIAKHPIPHQKALRPFVALGEKLACVFLNTDLSPPERPMYVDSASSKDVQNSICKWCQAELSAGSGFFAAASNGPKLCHLCFNNWRFPELVFSSVSKMLSNTLVSQYPPKALSPGDLVFAETGTCVEWSTKRTVHCEILRNTVVATRENAVAMGSELPAFGRSSIHLALSHVVSLQNQSLMTIGDYHPKWALSTSNKLHGLQCDAEVMAVQKNSLIVAEEPLPCSGKVCFGLEFSAKTADKKLVVALGITTLDLTAHSISRSKMQKMNKDELIALWSDSRASLHPQPDEPIYFLLDFQANELRVASSIALFCAPDPAPPLERLSVAKDKVLRICAYATEGTTVTILRGFTSKTPHGLPRVQRPLAIGLAPEGVVGTLKNVAGNDGVIVFNESSLTEIGAVLPYLPLYLSHEIITITIDFDAKRVFFYRNGQQFSCLSLAPSQLHRHFRPVIYLPLEGTCASIVPDPVGKREFGRVQRVLSPDVFTMTTSTSHLAIVKNRRDVRLVVMQGGAAPSSKPQTALLEGDPVACSMEGKVTGAFPRRFFINKIVGNTAQLKALGDHNNSISASQDTTDVQLSCIYPLSNEDTSVAPRPIPNVFSSVTRKEDKCFEVGRNFRQSGSASYNGIMFDCFARDTVEITSVEFFSHHTGTRRVQLFYLRGSSRNSAMSPAAWEKAYDGPLSLRSGACFAVRHLPMLFQTNETFAIYVQVDHNCAVGFYTDEDRCRGNVGDSIDDDGTILIMMGRKSESSTSFSDIPNQPRGFKGKLNYTFSGQFRETYIPLNLNSEVGFFPGGTNSFSSANTSSMLNMDCPLMSTQNVRKHCCFVIENPRESFFVSAIRAFIQPMEDASGVDQVVIAVLCRQGKFHEFSECEQWNWIGLETCFVEVSGEISIPVRSCIMADTLSYCLLCQTFGFGIVQQHRCIAEPNLTISNLVGGVRYTWASETTTSLATRTFSPGHMCNQAGSASYHGLMFDLKARTNIILTEVFFIPQTTTQNVQVRLFWKAGSMEGSERSEGDWKEMVSTVVDMQDQEHISVGMLYLPMKANMRYSLYINTSSSCGVRFFNPSDGPVRSVGAEFDDDGVLFVYVGRKSESTSPFSDIPTECRAFKGKFCYTIASMPTAMGAKSTLSLTPAVAHKTSRVLHCIRHFAGCPAAREAINRYGASLLDALGLLASSTTQMMLSMSFVQFEMAIGDARRKLQDSTIKNVEIPMMSMEGRKKSRKLRQEEGEESDDEVDQESLQVGEGGVHLASGRHGIVQKLLFPSSGTAGPQVVVQCTDEETGAPTQECITVPANEMVPSLLCGDCRKAFCHRKCIVTQEPHVLPKTFKEAKQLQIKGLVEDEEQKEEQNSTTSAQTANKKKEMLKSSSVVEDALSDLGGGEKLLDSHQLLHLQQAQQQIQTQCLSEKLSEIVIPEKFLLFDSIGTVQTPAIDSQNFRWVLWISRGRWSCVSFALKTDGALRLGLNEVKVFEVRLSLGKDNQERFAAAPLVLSYRNSTFFPLRVTLPIMHLHHLCQQDANCLHVHLHIEQVPDASIPKMDSLLHITTPPSSTSERSDDNAMYGGSVCAWQRYMPVVTVSEKGRKAECKTTGGQVVLGYPLPAGEIITIKVVIARSDVKKGDSLGGGHYIGVALATYDDLNASYSDIRQQISKVWAVQDLKDGDSQSTQEDSVQPVMLGQKACCFLSGEELTLELDRSKNTLTFSHQKGKPGVVAFRHLPNRPLIPLVRLDNKVASVRLLSITEKTTSVVVPCIVPCTGTLPFEGDQIAAFNILTADMNAVCCVYPLFGHVVSKRLPSKLTQHISAQWQKQKPTAFWFQLKLQMQKCVEMGIFNRAQFRLPYSEQRAGMKDLAFHCEAALCKLGAQDHVVGAKLLTIPVCWEEGEEQQEQSSVVKATPIEQLFIEMPANVQILPQSSASSAPAFSKDLPLFTNRNSLAGFYLNCHMYCGNVVVRASLKLFHLSDVSLLDLSEPLPVVPHECVVETYAVLRSAVPVRGIVPVLLSRGEVSLATIFEQKIPLTDLEKLTIGYCLFCALEHYHAHGRVHGRVDPRNIFVDRFGTEQIGAALWNGLDVSDSIHQAPEAVDNLLSSCLQGTNATHSAIVGKPTAEEDIWAAGSIFYQLLTTDYTPLLDTFDKEIHAAQIRSINDGNDDVLPTDGSSHSLLMALPLNIRPQAVPFLRKLLNLNPSCRQSASKILSDYFLADFVAARDLPPEDGSFTTGQDFTQDGCGSYNGIMFNIVAKEADIEIKKFVFLPDTRSLNRVRLFYKNGCFAGSETHSYDWEVLLDAEMQFFSRHEVELTDFPPIKVRAGQTVAIFIHTTSSSGVLFYTDDEGITSRMGEIQESNNVLGISVGKKSESTTPFSSIQSQRRYFRGTIHYTIASNGDVRRTRIRNRKGAVGGGSSFSNTGNSTSPVCQFIPISSAASSSPSWLKKRLLYLLQCMQGVKTRMNCSQVIDFVHKEESDPKLRLERIGVSWTQCNGNPVVSNPEGNFLWDRATGFFQADCEEVELLSEDIFSSAEEYVVHLKLSVFKSSNGGGAAPCMKFTINLDQAGGGEVTTENELVREMNISASSTTALTTLEILAGESETISVKRSGGNIDVIYRGNTTNLNSILKTSPNCRERLQLRCIPQEGTLTNSSFEARILAVIRHPERSLDAARSCMYVPGCCEMWTPQLSLPSSTSSRQKVSSTSLCFRGTTEFEIELIANDKEERTSSAKEESFQLVLHRRTYHSISVRHEVMTGKVEPIVVRLQLLNRTPTGTDIFVEFLPRDEIISVPITVTVLEQFLYQSMFDVQQSAQSKTTDAACSSLDICVMFSNVGSEHQHVLSSKTSSLSPTNIATSGKRANCPEWAWIPSHPPLAAIELFQEHSLTFRENFTCCEPPTEHFWQQTDITNVDAAAVVSRQLQRRFIVVDAIQPVYAILYPAITPGAHRIQLRCHTPNFEYKDEMGSSLFGLFIQEKRFAGGSGVSAPSASAPSVKNVDFHAPGQVFKNSSLNSSFCLELVVDTVAETLTIYDASQTILARASHPLENTSIGLRVQILNASCEVLSWVISPPAKTQGLMKNVSAPQIRYFAREVPTVTRHSMKPAPVSKSPEKELTAESLASLQTSYLLLAARNAVFALMESASASMLSSPSFTFQLVARLPKPLLTRCIKGLANCDIHSAASYLTAVMKLLLADQLEPVLTSSALLLFQEMFNTTGATGNALRQAPLASDFVLLLIRSMSMLTRGPRHLAMSILANMLEQIHVLPYQLHPALENITVMLNGLYLSKRTSSAVAQLGIELIAMASSRQRQLQFPPPPLVGDGSELPHHFVNEVIAIMDCLERPQPLALPQSLQLCTKVHEYFVETRMQQNALLMLAPQSYPCPHMGQRFYEVQFSNRNLFAPGEVLRFGWGSPKQAFVSTANSNTASSGNKNAPPSEQMMELLGPGFESGNIEQYWNALYLLEIRGGKEGIHVLQYDGTTTASSSSTPHSTTTCANYLNLISANVTTKLLYLMDTSASEVYTEVGLDGPQHIFQPLVISTQKSAVGNTVSFSFAKTNTPCSAPHELIQLKVKPSIQGALIPCLYVSNPTSIGCKLVTSSGDSELIENELGSCIIGDKLTMQFNKAIHITVDPKNLPEPDILPRSYAFYVQMTQFLDMILSEKKLKGINSVPAFYSKSSQLSLPSSEIAQYPLVQDLCPLMAKVSPSLTAATATTTTTSASGGVSNNSFSVPMAEGSEQRDLAPLKSYAFMCEALNNFGYELFKILNLKSDRNNVLMRLWSKMKGLIFFKTRNRIMKRALSTSTGRSGSRVNVSIHQQMAQGSRRKGIESTLQASIFGQLFSQLNSAPITTYYETPMFHVRLIGFGAQDAGGPYREVMSLLGSEMHTPHPSGEFNLNPLFMTSPNGDTVMPNYYMRGSQHKRMYIFFGKLLAFFLCSHDVLPADFPQLFWKMLIGDSVGREDYYQLDRHFVRRLTPKFIESILDMNELEEYFPGILHAWSQLVLAHGGEVEDLMEHRATYIIDAVLEMEARKYEFALEAIREGFQMVVPGSAMKAFFWRDISTKISGGEVTISALKQCTTCNLPSELKETFWRVVERFTSEDRSLLLRFATGQRRLPLKQQLEVRTMSGDRNALPTASTCFFKLMIPKYASENAMHEKLLYAIRHSVAIDADGTAEDRLWIED